MCFSTAAGAELVAGRRLAHYLAQTPKPIGIVLDAFASYMPWGRREGWKAGGNPSIPTKPHVLCRQIYTWDCCHAQLHSGALDPKRNPRRTHVIFL